MRRRLVRPFGQSITASRAMSLLMLLAVLWMLYGWVKNPAIWTWMANRGEDEQSALPNGPGAESPKELAALPGDEVQIVPGPNDLDPKAVEEFKTKSALVNDRAPLRPREMPIYWQLMAWSRTEPFEKLKARAAKDVAFSQLWETSSKYRGQLIHLKLHVRRVLRYEAEENPLKMKTVYEAWGWTEDSKSFPYVIVFPERPQGLPIGTDVRTDVEFVGYHFKIMTYTAFDVPRGAPLLVGRIQLASKPPPVKQTSATTFELVTMSIIGLVVLGAFGIWYLLTPRRLARNSILPSELSLGTNLEHDSPFADQIPCIPPVEELPQVAVNEEQAVEGGVAKSQEGDAPPA